jgi:hypothetical protein
MFPSSGEGRGKPNLLGLLVYAFSLKAKMAQTQEEIIRKIFLLKCVQANKHR